VWPPLWPIAFVLALASLVVRYRRAGALERRQLAWFAYAGALIASAQALAFVVDSAYLNVAPLAALPLAVGIAVERHRLYELERLVSGTVLAGFVVLVSVACVALLGGWGAALAALVAAVAVRPLHRRTTKLVYREPEPALSIRTLGGFRVFRDGEPVTAWPSKKARTLLKILVAHRGRPVPREALMEALWPGEDPRKLGNRLSVALSTLRDTLGREPDALVADADAIALELSVASVDVERLLAADDPVLVERLYGGDFLEEDRYEDWAADLREQARAAYGAALRARARDAKHHDEAVRAYLRLLEHDRYDAAAHRDLIARLERAGRHGEAIARRRAYIRQMAEIDVAASF
jgi:DNA-binding SARP family transcriptional activator